jgi:hypothetical protein
MGLGVVPPEAVVARKTAALRQVGLVVDDPFPFPWLFVMLEVEALKPMRAGVVMVAGRSGLKTQLRELMVMNGTGHGVVTMLVQLGSLGRQESSYCRPYREPVRYHTCGHQGLLQQRVALLLWRPFAPGNSCDGHPMGWSKT